MNFDRIPLFRQVQHLRQQYAPVVPPLSPSPHHYRSLGMRTVQDMGVEQPADPGADPQQDARHDLPVCSSPLPVFGRSQ